MTETINHSQHFQSPSRLFWRDLMDEVYEPPQDAYTDTKDAEEGE